MKQIFKYLGILIIGIFIGFLIFFLREEETEPEIVQTIYKEKVKTRRLKDTVVMTELIQESDTLTDTLTLEDTLQTVSESFDTMETNTPDEFQEEIVEEEVTEEDIITERLVSKRTVTIRKEANDTLDATELLNIKSKHFSSSMIIEFWESPLELTGYELSRNKLKLFGFNPNESISLRVGNKKDQLILESETLNLVLSKTGKFKSLTL